MQTKYNFGDNKYLNCENNKFKYRAVKRIFFLFYVIVFISCAEEKTYKLTTSVVPPNSGEIIPNSGNYTEGSSVVIEAINNEGYDFNRWSGDVTDSNNPLSISVYSDINIVAEFTEIDINSSDTDGDGVPDNIDICTDTPVGFMVDQNGCRIKNEFDQDYYLVWSDEFYYEGKLDSTKWHHQIIPPNGGSWWNGEEQHYTNKIENSYVSDSTMKIKAIKENYNVDGSVKNYTSARLNSKYGFKYGRVDVRAKLPSSIGTWPAIWTLGTNINEVGNYFGDSEGNVGWPRCGEIDIMEQNGWDKSETYGHFHWGNTNNGNYENYGNKTSIDNPSDDYHIYTLEWTKDHLKIMLDNNIFLTMNNSQSVPYDNPHYILLNIAMGGNLGGTIDPNFSQDIMEIDYVRVFKKD